MAYFLIAYLCISLPVAVWFFFSQEGGRGRLGVLLGYLMVSIALLTSGQIFGPSISKGLVNFIKPDGSMLPMACSGHLDEAIAGLRQIQFTQKEVFQAGVGEKLYLRGWIGSTNSMHQPVTVRLVSKKDGGKVDFRVMQENRPDVVTAQADPGLLYGGFRAEAQLPQRLPLGRYRIVVECRDGKEIDQYEPHCEVEVVSALAVAALDEPPKLQIQSGSNKKPFQVAPSFVPQKSQKYKDKKTKTASDY